MRLLLAAPFLLVGCGWFDREEPDPLTDAELDLPLPEPVSGVTPGRPRGDATGRPNVVLVSIDTLRADHVGVYGDPTAVTPVLDGLAAEGVLFASHVSVAPWTTPAHMSLFTSLAPHGHGVMQPFATLLSDLSGGMSYPGLSEERVTLAEVLHDAGYATAAFTGGATLDPRIGFARGFEVYDTTQFKLDDVRMERVLGWLREHHEAPFFLFWHHFEAHAPYLHTDALGDELPPEARGPVVEGIAAMATALRGRNPSLALQARLHRRMMALFEEHGAFRPEVMRALYRGGVTSADRWLGVLIDELRRLGRLDDTLIVVTSDHGEEFADHNPANFYDRHGHSLYEELVHVPLVVRLPGGAHAGTRFDGVTSTLDVMPTILDVVGLEGPADQQQGRSLVPAWTGEGLAPRPAFSEALAFRHEAKAIRDGALKLIHTLEPEVVEAVGRTTLPEAPSRTQLFDLSADPRERQDRSADPALATRLGELDATLRAWVAADHGRGRAVQLDADVSKLLENLGYMDPDKGGAGDAGAR